MSSEQTAARGRTLRWGVLGTAGINDAVLPAIQGSRARPGDCHRQPVRAKAEDQARRFGITTAYEGYEQLLADPQVDAVYLPLPNHLHKPWVLAAVAAGKHVLCEKPMALTAGDAEEMPRLPRPPACCSPRASCTATTRATTGSATSCAPARSARSAASVRRSRSTRAPSST